MRVLFLGYGGSFTGWLMMITNIGGTRIMIRVSVSKKGNSDCCSCFCKLGENEKHIIIGNLVLCEVCSGYVTNRLNEIFVQSQPKLLGRNNLCKCGSGKKYKNCCLV